MYHSFGMWPSKTHQYFSLLKSLFRMYLRVGFLFSTKILNCRMYKRFGSLFHEFYECIIDLDHFWLQKVTFAFRRFQKASEGRCLHVWMKILKFPLWQFIVRASHFNDAWYTEAKKHAFRISHLLNAYSSETKIKSSPLTADISHFAFHCILFWKKTKIFLSVALNALHFTNA